MRYFEGLQPGDVEGLSYWFWLKESRGFVISYYKEIIFTKPIGKSDWFWLLFFIVFAPVVMATTLALAVHHKQLTITSVQRNEGFVMYNKSTIEYFTIIQTLRGKNDRFK